VSLPHVLLGLLSEMPRTGYDLASAMRDEMDPAWSAGFSQIYPTLARLRRRGWVRLRVLGPRRGPRRNLYRMTAAGRRELVRWLGEAAPIPRGNDDALVRIALLDALPASDRRRALASAEAALGAEVARLRSLPAPGGYRSLARRGAIERLDALRRFLRAGGAAPLSVSEAHGYRPGARKKR
jgi:DNA-binding PadR family transcriptional regulator